MLDLPFALDLSLVRHAVLFSGMDLVSRFSARWLGASSNYWTGSRLPLRRCGVHGVNYVLWLSTSEPFTVTWIEKSLEK